MNSVQFNLTFQFVKLKMPVMGIAERKSRQKHALRERILDAARRIVMSEGFAALSMRKIADAIEYSPATLYLHFASRDEIAHALCEEGFAQLLKSFEPLVAIADPAERLKAFGRAYVAFGVAHPQTYRLIFMEDPSYTGAAFGGKAKGAPGLEAAEATESTEAGVADARVPLSSRVAGSREADATAPVASGDDAGAASLRIMISALDELKATGRLPASTDANVWAEAFWATMHGIVALNLTCPVFPGSPLETVVEAALGAWLGAAQAAPKVVGRASRAKGGAGAAGGQEDAPAAKPVASNADGGKSGEVVASPSERRKPPKGS
jgi:AcrR family transcriptional regulator